jgi:hypothetical protein
MDSVVYLNGRQVAAHPYGYTGFAVDLKDAHADDRTKNVVAVQVRNKLPSSRWYSGSGIYRHVHLVVTEPTHVARHGTFVTTPGVESTFKQGFANVHVSNDVVGASEDTSVVTTVRADASYSGRPDTLPAAMLDGSPATAWSNYYLKAATALLPSFSLAHAKEWVSVAWPGAQSVGTVRASLIADATRALPADIAVKYWDGGTWVAVSDQHVTPASASGEPTEIMFDPVSTTRLRLDMTSAHPKAGNGFIAISALEVPAAAVQ